MKGSWGDSGLHMENLSDESGNVRLHGMKVGDGLMTREGVLQRRATGVVFFGGRVIYYVINI